MPTTKTLRNGLAPKIAAPTLAVALIAAAAAGINAQLAADAAAQANLAHAGQPQAQPDSQPDNQAEKQSGKKKAPPPGAPGAAQLSLFDVAPNPVVEYLKRLNVNELTPIEALTRLYELQKIAQRPVGSE